MARLVCGTVERAQSDAWVETLSRELGPREPRFVQEPLLEPGTIHWSVNELPNVYVAPDVYVALQKRGIVACHG